MLLPYYIPVLPIDLGQWGMGDYYFLIEVSGTSILVITCRSWFSDLVLRHRSAVISCEPWFLPTQADRTFDSWIYSANPPWGSTSNGSVFSHYLDGGGYCYDWGNMFSGRTVRIYPSGGREVEA